MKKDIDKKFIIEKINEKFNKQKHLIALYPMIVPIVLSTSYKNLTKLRESNQLNWVDYGRYHLYTKSDIADYILKNINKKKFKILN